MNSSAMRQLLFLLLVLPTWVLGQKCLPLPECEPVFHMIKNKDHIPGMSRSQVLSSIRSLLCGFENRTPKVLCNEEEEEDEADYEDEAEDETVNEIISARNGGGGVIDLNTDKACDGALRLYHFRPAAAGAGADIRTTVLKRKFYSNLRRLESRQVFSSQVNGNCCWKISSYPRMLGQQQLLQIGDAASPEVQPRAAKKSPCQ